METQLVLDQPQGKKRRFVRHFVEMVVVMMVGMMVLGAAFGAFHQLAFGSGFANAWRDHVGLAAFAMAFNMTVLPLLPAFVPYGFGAIPAPGVLGMQMMLMIPAMLGATLYRKAEYSEPHIPHGHRKRWFALAG